MLRPAEAADVSFISRWNSFRLDTSVEPARLPSEINESGIENVAEVSWLVPPWVEGQVAFVGQREMDQRFRLWRILENTPAWSSQYRMH